MWAACLSGDLPHRSRAVAGHDLSAEEVDRGGGEDDEARARREIRAYPGKWHRKREWHARAPGGPFRHDNLVPRPQPSLWQDAPEAPLTDLESPEAQGRLSVCQLYGCMEPSGVHAGVPTYAHATGDLNFQRRFSSGGKNNRKLE